MSIEVPPWSRVELDVMRIGLGFVVLKSFARLPWVRPSGVPPHPVGIARLHDMKWAADRSTARRIMLGSYFATLLYVADVLVPFALLYLSVALVVEVTFRNSWGGVNAGDSLLAIVLIAQTAAILLWNAAEHWSWDLGALLAGSQEATATWWAVQSIIAVYFTAGLSKVINTRGRWIYRSPGILLSARARVDIDRLTGEESWGASGSSLALVSWLSDRPTITRCLFGAGLLTELAPPLGLLNELILMLIGLGLIGLHRANGLLLGLPFLEFQLLVLIYLVNVPQLVR